MTVQTEGWERVGVAGSLTARIVDQIIRKVRERELSPGDRLPSERELATRLGVSRPVVREAISVLAARGQVSVQHGRGVFIADSLTTQHLRTIAATEEHDLLDLFAMREVLEVPAAGWAAERAEPAALQVLRDDLDALDQAARPEPDYTRMQRLDSQFHLHIVELAGNGFLLQMLGVLQEMLHAGMRTTLHLPGRYQSSREDHHRILAAIEAGDAEAARVAARVHILSALQAAREHLAGLRRHAEPA